MVTCKGPNGKIQISSKSMRQNNGSKYLEHRDASMLIANPELKASFDWLSANSPRGLQNAGINNYSSRYSTLDDILHRYIQFLSSILSCRISSIIT
jgi:ABC-type cobalamin transport system ATPase subunit